MSNDSSEYNNYLQLIQQLQQQQYQCNQNTNRSIENKSNNTKMKSQIQAACFLFLSILIIFLFVSNQTESNQSQVVISKEKQAFFDQSYNNESCHVFDSYDGSLNYLNKLMESNQFTFIYFYANWCARSHKFKRMIETLGCKYSKDMPFLAINCYFGTCKESFELVKYPYITLQTRDVGTYTYQGNCNWHHNADLNQ
jgi:hypothetical protein